VLPIDQIEVGHGAVWTVSTFDSIISRFDPDTMQEVAAIPVDSVDGLAVGDEHLWALSRATALLTQIDPDTNTTGRSVQVGESPTAVATGLGAIWVADEDGSIRRIDEDTLAVTVIPFGAEIRAMAFDEESDALWVDVA